MYIVYKVDELATCKLGDYDVKRCTGVDQHWG